MTASLAELERAMVREIAAPAGSGIYRKLVRRGLAAMLRFQLPRTAAHLGARWDRDVARFLDETLPRSHYLRDVAGELVRHVAPAWRGDPEIPSFIEDLARWELLAFEVANAPDDPPRGEPAALALDRRVSFARSLRIVRFAHAVHLLADDEASLAVPAAAPTRLCVYRDADHDLRHLALSPSAADILERLAAGAALGDAVSGAAAACGAALDEAFLQGSAGLLQDLTDRQVILGAI